jgi:hypothetical protein
VVQQQAIWHHYTSSSSTSSRPALLPFPASSSSASSKPPRTSSSPYSASYPSLRPLSFSLYAHDAERFALEHFILFAAAVEPRFVVKRRWVEEAAKRAGVELMSSVKKGKGVGRTGTEK